MEAPQSHTDFLEHFLSSCYDTSALLAQKQCERNPEYQAAQAQRDALFQCLVKMTGSWHLVDQYDGLRTYIAGVESECAYQQGFRDCIALLGWLGYPAPTAAKPPQNRPVW